MSRSIVSLAEEACRSAPECLPVIYNFVQTYRPEVADETIRARVYEAVEKGSLFKIARGIYFARSGQAQHARPHDSGKLGWVSYSPQALL